LSLLILIRVNTSAKNERLKCPPLTVFRFIRTQLKKVFWPPAFFGGIGASFQILDNHQVACGLGPTIKGLNRREIPLSGETRPRRDLEPKSCFCDAFYALDAGLRRTEIKRQKAEFLLDPSSSSFYQCPLSADLCLLNTDTEILPAAAF